MSSDRSESLQTPDIICENIEIGSVLDTPAVNFDSVSFSEQDLISSECISAAECICSNGHAIIPEETGGVFTPTTTTSSTSLTPANSMQSLHIECTTSKLLHNTHLQQHTHQQNQTPSQQLNNYSYEFNIQSSNHHEQQQQQQGQQRDISATDGNAVQQLNLECTLGSSSDFHNMQSSSSSSNLPSIYRRPRHRHHQQIQYHQLREQFKQHMSPAISVVELSAGATGLSSAASSPTNSSPSSSDVSLTPLSGRPFIIHLEGNIGAGKSRVFYYLKHGRYAPFIDFVEEPDNKWTNLNGQNLLSSFYKNPKQNAAQFQYYAFNTLLENHLRPCNKVIKFMERSIHSCIRFARLQYELGNLDKISLDILEHEYATANTHLEEVQPDLLIYLNVPIEECRHNVKIHNREEETKIIDLKYLELLQNMHLTWLKEEHEAKKNVYHPLIHLFIQLVLFFFFYFRYIICIKCLN